MSHQPAIRLYTTPWCPFCIQAKALLSQKRLTFDEIDLQQQPQRRHEMVQKTGRTSVPQIWIGTQHIGGCDELYRLERSGQLDTLIQSIPKDSS